MASRKRVSCLSSFNTAPMVKFVILAVRLVLAQLTTSKHINHIQCIVKKLNNQIRH